MSNDIEYICYGDYDLLFKFVVMDDVMLFILIYTFFVVNASLYSYCQQFLPDTNSNITKPQ